jgi:hypothetical protein
LAKAKPATIAKKTPILISNFIKQTKFAKNVAANLFAAMRKTSSAIKIADTIHKCSFFKKHKRI